MYICLKITENEETGAAGVSFNAGEEINTMESSIRKTRVEIIYAVMFVTPSSISLVHVLISKMEPLKHQVTKEPMPET